MEKLHQDRKPDPSSSLPLDGRQLRAFAILARTGSFTLAAKELFLSQSAVSHAMKVLEEDVGCRLLTRVNKKISVTQAGEQLLHHAGRILSEMEAARSSLNRLGKWGHPSLTSQLIREYFRQEKMVLNTVMDLGSMEAIKELVKLELGISILAPWIAQKELKDKSLVALPLGRRKLTRTWVIASNRGRRLNIAEETFIKICRAFTEKITVGH